MNGWILILLKMLKNGTAKVWLGPYIVQKAKRKCDLGFLSLKILKQNAVSVLFY